MKSFHHRLAWIGVVLAALATTGCEESADTGASDMDALAAQLEQSKQAAADAAAAEQARAAAAAKAAADAAADAQAKQAAEQAAALATAGVVGKRKYRNEVNGVLRYYGAMATVRVLAEDRAIGWQIKKSMDVYLATHDNKHPKDQEEYMREIIEPNMIELPELQPGEEFYYDPSDHELKIVEWAEEPAAESSVGQPVSDGSNAAPAEEPPSE